MSYLLEILGRGHIQELSQLFGDCMSAVGADEFETVGCEAEEFPDRPDVQSRLGLALLQRCRQDEAIGRFKAALRLKPEYLPARLGLACCYENQHREPLAIEQLELANVHHPGLGAILIALGYCHERLGNADKAAEYYRDLLADSPQAVSARQRLAAIDLAAGRVDQAIEHYEQLRHMTGQVSDRLCLANLYLRAGRAKDAIREFTASIALAPENWAARQKLAGALAEDGQLRQAVDELLNLISTQGEFPDLHVQAADLYAKMGDDEPAAAHYQAALDINPDYLEAAVKLATHHLRRGRFADAAAAFNRAAEINDRSLAAYVGLAVAQKNAGQFAAARDTLNLAGSLAPTTTLLFRETARLELKAAMARQGETVFTPGFAAPPAGGDDANDDGWDQLLDLQVQRHRQAAADRPNHADLQYRLGLLLTGAGDLQGAIEHYRQACQINPTYAKARIKLGLALQEAGQPDAAIAELKAALDVNPQFADVHYRLGLIYRDMEKFEQAADCFQRSLDINESNPEVRANLATCLESMGLLDRAGEQWRRLAEKAD